MSIKNIVLFVVLIAFNSAQALTVISDLDDTIKITRVSNHIEAIKNSLFSTDVFLGMPELMRSFKQSPGQNKLFIVSGNRDIVSIQVSKLLRVNSIEADDFFLVNGAHNKPEELNRLISETEDEVILLGNDQEKDPVFYEVLKKQYPDQIKAIYIHQLNQKILPEGQIGYLTAYEVAAHETAAGRLTKIQLEKVKNFISKNLKAKRNSKLLIPNWQDCSPDSVKSVLATTRALSEVDQEFLNRIETIANKNCND